MSRSADAAVFSHTALALVRVARAYSVRGGVLQRFRKRSERYRFAERALKLPDQKVTWWIIYRVGSDAIVIGEVLQRLDRKFGLEGLRPSCRWAILFWGAAGETSETWLQAGSVL